MSKKFNTSLLLLARQFRDLSQKEIAEACGLNQGHYSRIENGLLPDGPSDENVQKLAPYLGFEADFFYWSDEIAALPLSVHPMTRKKASLGERTMRTIQSELNVRMIHLRRLLAAVDLKSELELPWIDVDEGGGPVEVARTVRRLWGLPEGPIRNLTDICERAGILVIWSNLDTGIDGVTMRVRDLPVCVFLNRNAPADRMRFSLAHELGHVIMHRYPTDTIEDEANIFAGEFLVPQREYKSQLIGRRVTLEVLIRQKAFWRSSINFLLMHASRIGYINKNQSDYLWKQLSVRGWRTHEPAETEFEREKPVLFPRMIHLHAESLGYSPPELSKFLGISIADIHRLYGDAFGRQQLYVVK